MCCVKISYAYLSLFKVRGFLDRVVPSRRSEPKRGGRLQGGCGEQLPLPSLALGVGRGEWFSGGDLGLIALITHGTLFLNCGSSGEEGCVRTGQVSTTCRCDVCHGSCWQWEGGGFLSVLLVAYWGYPPCPCFLPSVVPSFAFISLASCLCRLSVVFQGRHTTSSEASGKNSV